MAKNGEKGSYWNGPDIKDRRIEYAAEFKANPALQANGDDTDRRIRACYAYYCSRHGGDPAEMIYSSGWRPSTVNKSTPGAAPMSRHMSADAGDVECDKAGHFAWWCYRNQWKLEQLGLWMEHPIATVERAREQGKTPWCHLQRTPSRSGERCFMPDTPAVMEWAKKREQIELAKSQGEEDGQRA